MESVGGVTSGFELDLGVDGEELGLAFGVEVLEADLCDVGLDAAAVGELLQFPTVSTCSPTLA